MDRSLIRSRKAVAWNHIMMMILVVLTFFTLMTCVFLINLFVNYKFDVTDVQAEVLINGLVYGTGGISYTDPVTGRIYPQIVDLGQLSESELDAGMSYPENNLISAKISVEDNTMRPIHDDIYYNRRWYQNWEPLLVYEGLPGIGGVKSYETRLPVLIRDEEGVMSRGYVYFQVVQPRSARAREAEDE